MVFALFYLGNGQKKVLPDIIYNAFVKRNDGDDGVTKINSLGGQTAPAII